MRLDETQARALFGTARVARLASVGADGAPHLVPIVFALRGATIYTAVDGKPKTTTTLRRLANIAAEPRVSVLADRYTEDWQQLWWVRADGVARVVPADADAIALLAARYPQYADEPPDGPVITIAVRRWLGWSAGVVTAATGGGSPTR